MIVSHPPQVSMYPLQLLQTVRVSLQLIGVAVSAQEPTEQRGGEHASKSFGIGKIDNSVKQSPDKGNGAVAHLVERSLRMGEALVSTTSCSTLLLFRVPPLLFAPEHMQLNTLASGQGTAGPYSAVQLEVYFLLWSLECLSWQYRTVDEARRGKSSTRRIQVQTHIRT